MVSQEKKHTQAGSQGGAAEKRQFSFLQQLLLVLLFNTFISLLLSAMGGHWPINIIVSQCIGISIFLLHGLALNSGLFVTRLQHVVMTLVTIVLGASLGFFIASYVLEWSMGFSFAFGGRAHLNVLVIGLFFGSIISYFFYSRYRMVEVERQAQAEQLQRMEREKELSLAQVKMIQAQIEPHFLFNTLANIASMIEGRPADARRMLDSLNQYLRITLDRTREGETTLQEELDLLDAYLSILQLRMGGRLSYAIECPPQLTGLRFPPLLIQPLVENAIRHGLEPKLEGGRLELHIEARGSSLSIEVRDNGLGLQGKWHPGIGLNNVHQRVKNLYGQEARLEISNNEQGGVSASLLLPGLPGNSER